MRVGAHFAKMGLRASQTSEIIFKDCRIPKENQLGKIGEGLKIAMNCFDHGRVGIAAQAVGITQAALDESIAYSKQRVQLASPSAGIRLYSGGRYGNRCSGGALFDL